MGGSLRTARFVMSALLTASLGWGAFSPCQFNFGRGFDGTTANYSGLDHITIWVGADATFNVYWQGAMLRKALEVGATPIYYGYIIGELGKRNGLRDCDVAGGSASLCTGGSNIIRTKRAEILSLYGHYAQETADIIGRNGDIIWLIEPDFYQYSASGGQNQSGGGIPNADMGVLFRDIVSAIRQHLPQAKISIDISPWITNQASWYANFDMSLVQYAHTSGGRTDANSTKIRNENGTTWAQIRQVTGKPIIADDGYGVGGGSTGHDATWDDANNLRARIGDGVVGISQQSARNDWASAVLGTLRPQLAGLVSCGTQSSSSVVSSSSRPSSSSVQLSSSSVSSSSSRPSSSSVQSSSSQGQSSNSTTVQAVPGRVEAEYYNTMSGLQLGDANDEGGGLTLGYIDNGDWAQYSIEVATAGTYNVRVRAASGGSGGTLVIRVSNNQVGTVQISNTGGWSNYQDFNVEVNLPTTGTRTLRLEFQGSGSGLYNLNYLEFSRPGQSSSSTQSSSSVQSSSSQPPSSSSTIPADGNLVRNGDFSQGTQHWTAQVNSPTGASGNLQDADGVLFVNVSWGGGASEDLVVQQENLSLASANYSLSFKAAVPQHQGGRDFQVRVTDGTNTYCEGDRDLTDEMVEFTCNFTAVAGNYRLEFLAGGAWWQDVLLDDVVLLGPAGSGTTRLALPRGDMVRYCCVFVDGNGTLRSRIPEAWLGQPVRVLDSRGRLLRVEAPRLGSNGEASLGNNLPMGTYYLAPQGSLTR